jgi:hypothetical protein
MDDHPVGGYFGQVIVGQALSRLTARIHDDLRGHDSVAADQMADKRQLGGTQQTPLTTSGCHLLPDKVLTTVGHW